MREDAGKAFRGGTLRTLTALRNALLRLHRHVGTTKVADAKADVAASATAARRFPGDDPPSP
jgi:hypothetical protein